MSELDAIVLHNPTSEDFTHNFNGDPYSIGDNVTKSFAKFAGYHLAKHLSSKIIEESYSEKDRKDPKQAVRISQSLLYDNPQRRIALYNILMDKNTVQDVIARYSFKGWVGEMQVYEDYVNKIEASQKEPEKVGDENPEVK